MATDKNKVKVAGEPTGMPTVKSGDFEVTIGTTDISFKVSWTNSDKNIKTSNANRYEGVLVQFFIDTFTDLNTGDNGASINTKAKTGSAAKKDKKAGITKKTKKVNEKKLSKASGTTKKTLKGWTVTGTKKVEKNGKKKTVITSYARVTTSTISDVHKGWYLKPLGKVASVKKTSYTIPADKKPSTGAYYPYTSTYVDGFGVELQGYNSYSKGKTDKFDKTIPTAYSYKNIGRPANPETSNAEAYDKSLRKCTLSYACSSTADNPCALALYNYSVTKYDVNKKPHPLRQSHSGDNRDKVPFAIPQENAKGLESWAETTELSKSFTYRMSGGNDYITLDEMIEVKLKAKAWGMGGPSYGDSNETSYTYAYPHDFIISSVWPAKIEDGYKGIVRINLWKDSNAQRRTDTVQLQRAKDFVPPEQKDMYKDDSRWLELVDSYGEWTNVGEEFAGDNTSTTRNYVDDKPSGQNRYSRTYYRIVAKNEIFTPMEVYRYSLPHVLPGYLDVPSARNEKVDFLAITSGSDGTSVKVTLVYQVSYVNNGKDPNSDGCILSWSEDPNAWLSNETPPMFEMPDLDMFDRELFRNPEKVPNPSNPSQQISNDAQWVTTDPAKLDELKRKYKRSEHWYTSTGYVRGLTEGTPYYFRAKRFLEETGNTPRTEGEWKIYEGDIALGTKQSTITPSTKPSAVTLMAKDSVPMGDDLEVSWTFDSDSTQKSWKLFYYNPKDLEYVNDTTASANATSKKKLVPKSGVNGGVLREGTDASGYTVIPFETEYDENGNLKALGMEDVLPDGGQIGLLVSVTLTGEPTLSSAVLVQYVEPPRVSLGCPEVLTTQPLRVTVGSNDPQSSIVLRVTSVDSASIAYPDRIDGQASGAVVYSKKYTTSEFTWQPDNLPTLPTSEVSSDADVYGEWTTVYPSRNMSYLRHYNTYQYVSNGETKWTQVSVDDPRREVMELTTVPTFMQKLWYASNSSTYPNPPTDHVTEAGAAVYEKWTKSLPTYSASRTHYYYCYEYNDSRYFEVDKEAIGYSIKNPHDEGWYERTGTSYSLSSDILVNTNKTYYRVSDAEYYEWTSVGEDLALEDLHSKGGQAGSATELHLANGDLGYYTNIQIPIGQNLLDYKVYEISAMVVNDVQKLDSRLLDLNYGYEMHKAKFTVDYEHKAKALGKTQARVLSNTETYKTSIIIDSGESGHTPPLLPDNHVTETGTSTRTWTTSVPAYKSDYGDYHHTYEYVADGNPDWSPAEYDRPLSELMALGSTVQSSTKLWYVSKELSFVPTAPTEHVSEDSDAEQVWTTTLPTLVEDNVNRSYYYYTYEYSVAGSESPSWTSVSRCSSVETALRYKDDETSVTEVFYESDPDRKVGDLFDIYRVTPDGASWIARNVSCGQTVVDDWAPFSKYANTRYRICSRTPNGVMDWEDFAYNLPNHAIRFDWGDPTLSKSEYTSLEIPYNLGYTDQFKKYFDARHYLGSKKAVGYWEEAVDRTGTFKTDIVKYEDPAEKEALRALAQYTGPVMVRRPDGCAYLANVEVDSISNDYTSLVVPVQFKVTEIELTEKYRTSARAYINETDSAYISSMNAYPDGFQDSKCYSTKMQAPAFTLP